VEAGALQVAEAPLQAGLAVEAGAPRGLEREIAHGQPWRAASERPIMIRFTESADGAFSATTASMPSTARRAAMSSVSSRPTAAMVWGVGRRPARPTAMSRAASATPR
jgi:hypothetical protein